MKKEVQALIKRRRARFVPAVLLAIAGLILIALVLLAVNFAMRGPGLGIVQTETPTVTATETPRPPTATASPTFTPGATDTATPTAGPSPTSTEVVYVVQEGDSLFTIAEQYSANVCLIMAVNNLTDPGLLTVGQSLIIPPNDLELPTATSLPTDLPRGARLEYVVQCGDTLELIASYFNSTAEDIAEENEISDPLSIQIGQVLVVRVNLVTPTPTATLTAVPAVSLTPTTAATAAP